MFAQQLEHKASIYQTNGLIYAQSPACSPERIGDSFGLRSSTVQQNDIMHSNKRRHDLQNSHTNTFLMRT